MSQCCWVKGYGEGVQGAAVVVVVVAIACPSVVVVVLALHCNNSEGTLVEGASSSMSMELGSILGNTGAVCVRCKGIS